MARFRTSTSRLSSAAIESSASANRRRAFFRIYGVVSNVASYIGPGPIEGLADCLQGVGAKCCAIDSWRAWLVQALLQSWHPRSAGPPRQPSDRSVVDAHGFTDRTAAFAGLGLLMLAQFRLAAEPNTPRLRPEARPSSARLTMRWRSSSARADKKARIPRLIGLVRSR